MDTTKNVVVVHNGSIVGGFPLALASGSAITAASLLVNNNLNISTGNAYQINGVSVLSATTLGSGVTASSLTSVGTLTALTVTGDLTVDTSTLKVDAANNRVGVGTASPNNTLDVITTTTATNTVVDTLRLSAITTNTAAAGLGTGIVFSAERPSGEINLSRAAIYGVSESENESGFLSFYTRTNTGPNDFNEKMRLDASGNLGIGVTPTSTLDVGASSPILRIHGLNNAVGTNDIYGALEFFTNDNSTPTNVAAKIDALSPGGFGDRCDLRFFTNSSTALVERARIDASGNLGVGTTSPFNSSKVSTNGSISSATSGVDGTYTPFLFGAFSSTPSQASAIAVSMSSVGTNCGFQFQVSSGTDANRTVAYQLNRTQHIWSTGGTERARITSGGYTKHSNNGTYLGSTASYHEFYQSNIEIGLALYAADGLYTSSLLYGQVNSSGTGFKFISWLDDGGERFFVRGDGNVYNTNTVYGGISDAKLKQDITDAGSQWDDLKAVRFRKYRFISDVQAKGEDAPYLLGVVAQELQATSPGLVDSHLDTEQVEVEVEVEKSRPVMHEVEEVVTDADGVESVVMKSVPMLDEDGKEITETYTETETCTETRKTGTETLAVKHSILLMKAAVALQEAMARIESLEARLDSLENL